MQFSFSHHRLKINIFWVPEQAHRFTGYLISHPGVSYIEGLVGYKVQVVYDIADGVPLPLAPATHIELQGPRPLYFKAL